MRKNGTQRAADRWTSTEDLGTQARQWLHRVNKEAGAHPFRTVGLAAGAGFVLGGGLFTPLTGRLLRTIIGVGLRVGMLPALSQGLALAGARLLDTKERE